MKFWVNTAIKNHIERGLAGGYTQANHGAAFGLKKLQLGDWIVHYAPKVAMDSTEPYQRFMAIGQVADDELYQVEITPEFHPYRRNITFKKEAQEVEIKPMLGELEFITDPKHWGLPFKKGLFEVSEADFAKIAAAMNVQLEL